MIDNDDDYDPNDYRTPCLCSFSVQNPLKQILGQQLLLFRIATWGLYIRDKMFSKSISSIEILYLSRLIRNDHLVRWQGQSHGGQPLVAGLPTYHKCWFLWVCGMLFWLTSSYSPIFGRGCKKSREVCLKFSLWKFYFNIVETQYSDKKSRVWLHCTFVKIWITKNQH